MELLIRVCPEHDYPVGMVSERPEFVCLSTFHRMEIEETKQRLYTEPEKKEIQVIETNK